MTYYSPNKVQQRTGAERWVRTSATTEMHLIVGAGRNSFLTACEQTIQLPRNADRRAAKFGLALPGHWPEHPCCRECLAYVKQMHVRMTRDRRPSSEMAKVSALIDAIEPTPRND
jgi:hypothetical protein